METKETLQRTNSESVMLENIEYYKYIFKKTEKIACSVFYILRNSGSISQNDLVQSDLEDAAKNLLDISLESLKSTRVAIDAYASELRHALISLESNLRIAHASRYLGTEILEVFLHEIDSVQRTLRKYTERGTQNPLTVLTEYTEVTRERKPARIRIGERQATQVNGGVENKTSRKDRVLAVLKDKGEATIKDIIDVVTDCSEKTIQRELISLIKDNVIVREGERRWSKYKLI
jgi:hypothetical protein